MIQESVVMNNVNTKEKKLIEELIEKLKHSDEKNQELRKALHTVDEQCEKLVVRCFFFSYFCWF